MGTFPRLQQARNFSIPFFNNGLIIRASISDARSSSGINEKIGYIDGDNAYDLAGKLCCRYEEASGNLLDLDTGKVIGHISLEGYFVGLSWIADDLFAALAEASAPSGNVT